MKTPPLASCIILAAALVAFHAPCLPARAAEQPPVKPAPSTPPPAAPPPAAAPATPAAAPVPPVPAPAPALEFAAYATIGDEQLFMLYDLAAKSPSRWLKVGQTWQGYTVLAFEPETESVSLRHETSELKLKLRTAKTETVAALPTPLPGLIKGSYTLLDGTILYSEDAQLRLGADYLISSHTGLMVSDDQQRFIGGDLTLETSRGTLQMQDAMLDVQKGTISAKGTVIFSQGNGPAVSFRVNRPVDIAVDGTQQPPALTKVQPPPPPSAPAAPAAPTPPATSAPATATGAP